MPKKWKLTLITVAVLFAGCHPDYLPIINTSQYTIKGVTYRAPTAIFFGPLGVFEYYTDSTNTIPVNANGGGLYLYFTKYPTAGAYKFVSSYPPTGNTSCYIAVNSENFADSIWTAYSSTGNIGDSLHVIIDSGNVKITFTNIRLIQYQGTDTATVSGTLIGN